MKIPPQWSLALLLFTLAACGGTNGARNGSSNALTSERAGGATASQVSREYVLGDATIDGIGKYYMGREISQVMGHLGASWLERETRIDEERTDLLMAFLLDLDADVVADIGVGTGYFALPWARGLGGGRVFGVDIQPEMLDILAARAEQEGLSNVVPVQGAVDDPGLPVDSVDVVLIVDAYHEFSHPREMMQGIVAGLRPGGRLVLVEYRGEDPFVPIKDLHKMTEEQAIREVEAAGLRWVATESFLPQQHVLVFEKPMA